MVAEPTVYTDRLVTARELAPCPMRISTNS